MAKVLLRLRNAPFALGQPGKLQVRGARRPERKAGLEIVLRLAPEFRDHAQPPQRGQQLRVFGVLAQPAFAALESYRDWFYV